MLINRHYSGTEFITGLRAIAVILVFIIHSGGGGLRSLSATTNTFVDWAKHGVAIFFVISGFTIFYQIYEKKYSLSNFLKVRLLRISLPYFPVLIFILLYSIFISNSIITHWGMKFNNGVITWDNFLAHLTYTSSFNLNYSNTIIGVEWTLGVEVFYYLLIGFIITRTLFQRAYVSMSFLLGLFSLLFYFIAYKLMHNKEFVDNYLSIHWSPMKYGFMFLLGGAVYFIRKYFEQKYTEKELNLISNIILILVVMLFILNLNIIIFSRVELTFVFLTFLLLIFTRDTSFSGKIMNNNIMLFVGSISFSFYLWHFIIINSTNISIPFIQQSIQYNFFYRLFITLIVSTLWYFIFEKHLYTKLKSKINKS